MGLHVVALPQAVLALEGLPASPLGSRLLGLLGLALGLQQDPWDLKLCGRFDCHVGFYRQAVPFEALVVFCPLVAAAWQEVDLV